jgi:hypothetical protein
MCVNTRDGKSYRLNEISRADLITLGDVLCGYIQHPEIKSLGPSGEKCTAETRGLLRRIPIKGGLHHPMGKEISRFEQGQDDFIENIDDAFIRYDGGRVAANESPAGNGASDLGAQDGGHHVNRLEERSALRRPTSETTNRLNVSSPSAPSWNFFHRWSVGFWRHSGSRASLR